MRRVVSVFLTSFATDRLRRLGRPETGPLVTARDDAGQRLIAAVSPQARALGLRPGQTVAHAQSLVAGLDVADAGAEAEAAALRDLAHACLRYAPLCAPDPPDGLFIETTGCAHLHGGEAAMLADLRRRLAASGYASRAAVAGPPGAAHALARYGPGEATVLNGPPQPALRNLPLACLRLEPGVVGGLYRVGVERVGHLAMLPRGPLRRRYGAATLLRLDQALGAVDEPIRPVLPAEPLAHRLAFAEPLATRDSLHAAITALTEAVCGKLERAGQGARSLDLLFERVDGNWQAIRIGTAQPNRAPAHLARLLAERLETVDPGLGVEAMRLVATRAEPQGWTQQASDAPATAGGVGVAELVDRLAGRFGPRHVFRVARVESAVPERSVVRVPALAGPTRRRWPLSHPRPARLFTPPHPVDAVALLPDHPPSAFIWRRVRHKVRRADGPERIFGEWWRSDREVAAVRDYFVVEDESGRRFWLYRRGDGVDPYSGDLRWYLHGLF